jgi:tetratricopeptide (TPR) repeat protein
MQSTIVHALFVASLALCGADSSVALAAQTDAPTTSVTDAARAQRLAQWNEALELDLASSILQSALELEGGPESLRGDGEALAIYARALAATGQPERARAVLTDAEEDASGRTAIEIELAGLDLLADELAAVETRLAREDGSLRPEFDAAPRARFLLGRARVRAGSAAAARVPLDEFVARWPRHADAPAAWHMLTQEALERRDLERARECRERADELGRWHAYYRTRRLQRRANPDAPEPRIGLAQLWIAAEDFERARTELAPVLAAHPEACAAWTTLGEIERKEGKPAESRAAYTRAIDCDPDAHVARFALALLLLDADESVAARSHLERLCDSPAGAERRFVGAHLMLARLLAGLGEAQAAEARYARYRELGGTEELVVPK